MVRQAKAALKYILPGILTFFFAYCANQLPPGGGDIDRIPPVILEVYPSDGTLNYRELYFEISFSEYVDKRSVKEAIFISPAIDGNITLDWSGKSVTVEFPGALKENTTYNITIGTDVADLNNQNKMSEAFNFSFSTGSKLDRRVISGKVHSEKPQGIMLFAYLNPEDTLNPSTKKPTYISQSGLNGDFRIPGLAAGRYRIFAVQDEFRDLLFNAEQDKIGIPYNEVELKEDDTLFSGLDFFLFAADTVRPRMLTSVMTDQNHALLSFSEELDHSSVSSVNFTFYDSTAKRELTPLYAYSNINKPVEIILAIKDSIPEGNLLYIFADTLKDLTGNIYLDESNPVTVSARPDTIKPFIIRMIPPAGNESSDFFYQTFNFAFNDGVDTSIVKNSTSFTDTSRNKIRFTMNFIDDASFRIVPAEPLEPRKDYIISFDVRKVSDAAGNRLDSIYQYKFKTISGLDFTGVSGRIENIDVAKNPQVQLVGIDEKKLTYGKKISTSRFDFERIEPGTYRLWAFYDSDSNGVYSKGWHFPFVPSENFSFYQDSLVLRPRWAITDIIFNFGK